MCLAVDDVLAEVDAGHPQADDLRAQPVGNVDRIDAVAERFRHGAALLVEGPAGGPHHAERRLVLLSDADRGEQGSVEPASILIAAFEIQIGWRPSPGSASSTACQLDPESNQTSRMSVSRRKAVPPQLAQCAPLGQHASAAAVCHASTPSLLK